jgi:hypothetical protein
MFRAFLFHPESRARRGKPGMGWARRMDESPNPGEKEEPGVRLDRIPPSGWKKCLPETKSGGRLEMLLCVSFRKFPPNILHTRKVPSIGKMPILVQQVRIYIKMYAADGRSRFVRLQEFP